jgi:hypothetical protein
MKSYKDTIESIGDDHFATSMEHLSVKALLPWMTT